MDLLLKVLGHGIPVINMNGERILSCERAVESFKILTLSAAFSLEKLRFPVDVDYVRGCSLMMHFYMYHRFV